MTRNILRLGAALALTAAPAFAQQTYVFNTSVSEVQPSNIGSITLTQVGAVSDGVVNVFVDLLNPTYGFLNTGNHTPFAFNLLGGTSGLTATFSSPLGGSYTAPGGGTGTFTLNTAGGPNPPYGDFGVALDINGVGNGSNNAYYGDLNFTLTRAGLTTNSFTTNAGGYYFSADITNGQNTGAVAWGVRGTPGGGTGSVVPEPSTYVLLASGMVGLVGIARRRQQQG